MKNPLTKRETEILQLASYGKENKEIARNFNITEQTVKNYITKILLKLEASNRISAILKAIKLGIISFPELEFG
jgi:DNA-binding NarL/FixJ family response regulator